MATASQVINRAARLAKVKGRKQDLNGGELNEYLDLLNEMLDSWRNNGVDLGLPTLTATSEIYIDDADLLALRYNLARLISDNAGGLMSLDKMQQAVNLKDDLISKYIDIQELETPCIMSNNSTFNIDTGY